MLSLHTNAAALSTQNAVAFNNKSLSSSMTKLGTGFRINSAMDDAAGLQIANRLKAQHSGMKVAMRNTQNATSLMQTAEGALSEVNTMLVRMKDLATQSADASASTADKKAMQAEYDSLASEITNIMGNTTFGGEKLMNNKVTTAQKATAQLSLDTLKTELGTAADALTPTARDNTTTPPTAASWAFGPEEGTQLQKTERAAEKAFLEAQEAYDLGKDGATAPALANTLKTASAAYDTAKQEVAEKKEEITKAEAYVAALNSPKGAEDGKFAQSLSFQIGATSSEAMSLNLTAQLTQLHEALSGVSGSYTSIGVSAGTPGNELTENASSMIDKLQTVLDNVGALRSDLGAASNRLQHTNANLGNMSTSTESAIGRIMDVDYATETSNMTKNQMLMQASSAMLKQSNSMSQMVASLLQ